MTNIDKPIIRELLLQDHLAFSRYFFKHREGIKFVSNWHHKEICKAVQRVIDGETQYLVINIPPGWSKTELVVINLIARGLAINPRSRFLHLSYSSTLAELNSAKARDLILSQEYQELFPMPIKPDSSSRARWNVVTDEGVAIGGCYATSILGQVTGFRAGNMQDGFQGCVIVDDPLKPDDALSKVMRDRTNQSIINTIKSRRAWDRTPIIFIMQRLAEEDPSGFLIDGKEGHDWETLVIPALDDDGKSNWEFKDSTENLILMREKSPFVFAGQYQQSPYVLGGELIKGQWFKRYDQLPNWRNFRRRYIFADTAMKTAEHNDYTVFLDALEMRTGEVYILNLWRKKVDAVGLLQLSKDIWSQVSVNRGRENIPPASAMCIEDKASGTGLIQQLKQNESFIPVIAVERTKDKLTRLLEVQGHIQSGLVYLPEQAEWVLEFISECEAFTATDTHKHDDQIDPLIDCVNTFIGAADFFNLNALV